jgi:hypothetical protein
MVLMLTHNQEHGSPQDALLHYGVKGMRWGVTNEDGPAGPSRSEKKQAKRDVKAAELRGRAAKVDIQIKELDSEISKYPPGTGIRNTLKRNELTNIRTQTVAQRDVLAKTATAVEQGRMTPNQKKLLIAGAIGGGLVLAAYGGSKFQSGEAQVMIAKGKARLRGKPFGFDKNDHYANARTPDEVLAMSQGINPGFRSPGGAMNCRRCTMTYELRRRGFNVDATTSSIGYGQSESGLINALTPGQRNINSGMSMSRNVVAGLGIRGKAGGDTRKNPAETYSHADAKDREGFLALLRQQPDGARGEAVFNFGAFGHSLAYERFGDQTFIFDTQKGKRYSVDKPEEYNEFLSKWGWDRVSDVAVTRLDNRDLDTTFLARWSTNSRQSAQPLRIPQPVSRPKPSAALLRKATNRPAGMHIVNWNRIRREAGLEPASGSTTSTRPANMSKEVWNALQEVTL